MAPWLAASLAVAAIGCVETLPTGPASAQDPAEETGSDTGDGGDTANPMAGSVEVSIVTTGRSLDMDPDGYEILVDGEKNTRSGVNQRRLLAALEPGDHVVELADLAANCAVEGKNPVTVGVTAGETSSIDFQVRCAFLSRHIAFVRQDYGPADIYIMDADGSGVARISAADELGDSQPVWSPDGSRIAFQRFDGEDWDWFINLWVMDADGSNRVALTDEYGADPAWSPDGTRIAFAGIVGANYNIEDTDIYLIDPDGSNRIRLTDAPGDDGEPAWSPDGSRIAFVSERDGDREVYVMNADGSNPVNLTNDRSDDGEPAWSPDGTKIAFTSDRDGNDEIHVMDADGSNAVNLTRNASFDRSPTWSPDGSKIVFTTRRDDNYEIYLMDADGSNAVNLTDNPAADYDPAWSSVP